MRGAAGAAGHCATFSVTQQWCASERGALGRRLGVAPTLEAALIDASTPQQSHFSLFSSCFGASERFHFTSSRLRLRSFCWSQSSNGVIDHRSANERSHWPTPPASANRSAPTSISNSFAAKRPRRPARGPHRPPATGRGPPAANSTRWAPDFAGAHRGRFWFDDTRVYLVSSS